jgi:hypothetical protein
MNLIAHQTQSKLENILDSCPIVISLLYDSARSSHGGASRGDIVRHNAPGADHRPLPDAAAGKVLTPVPRTRRRDCSPRG